MHPVLAFNLGTSEIILLLVVALLLFGTTRLPKLARAMGQSVGEFKQGLKDPPKPDDPAAPASEDATAGSATKTTSGTK